MLGAATSPPPHPASSLQPEPPPPGPAGPARAQPEPELISGGPSPNRSWEPPEPELILAARDEVERCPRRRPDLGRTRPTTGRSVHPRRLNSDSWAWQRSCWVGDTSTGVWASRRPHRADAADARTGVDFGRQETSSRRPPPSVAFAATARAVAAWPSPFREHQSERCWGAGGKLCGSATSASKVLACESTLVRCHHHEYAGRTALALTRSSARSSASPAMASRPL